MIEFVLIGVILLIGTRADEYIVQFERKQTLAVLHAELRRAGLTPKMRRNAAVDAFPTDFAVIESHSINERESILSRVNGARRVFRNARVQLQPQQQQQQHDDDENQKSHSGQKPDSPQVVDALRARSLWKRGVRGGGVRVAVFDTGLRAGHPHFKRVREVTNWTDERALDDALGHGTFVASVIAGADDGCAGVAPDADLHIFRVFTSGRVSYTAWFLDAMNYAIHTEVDILNLSIGGPDFMDRPFVEKVWELSANNIVVVSAIGNDGPLYGTLNNPADQMDVIGVGGVDYSNQIAKFSSRGMTTWELPRGYGRVKPDLVAYGKSVRGSKIYGGCRSLSGTSVASPVVAGAVALLIGAVEAGEQRARLVNPASVKQALLETAMRVPDANVFEQGAGRLQLEEAVAALQRGELRASFHPPAYDLTECPYMWPYCVQPLYVGALPLTLNATLLNGMGVTGEFVGPIRWLPGINGERVQIAFERPSVLWPWSGWLAIRIAVTSAPPDLDSWLVEGVVEARVRSPPARGERQFREQTVQLPVRLRAIRTPPRSRRLLWDQFHNVRYPAGYAPRDVLSVKHEPFDWNADHPHTNFRGLFEHLRRQGYFVEVLGEHFGCVELSQYGALLIVDTEDEFHVAERDVVRRAVAAGLGVIVAADWYNVDVMRHIKFFDENTKQWWTPVTGGANVPALNELLGEFGIALGDDVVRGDLLVGDRVASYASGSTLRRFPAGGALVHATLINETAELLADAHDAAAVAAGATHKPPVIGVMRYGGEWATKRGADVRSGDEGGVVAVLGDASCLDDSHHTSKRPPCYWLLDILLEIATQNAPLSLMLPEAEVIATPLALEAATRRSANSTLARISNVIDRQPQCESIVWHRVDTSLRIEEPIFFPTGRTAETNAPTAPVPASPPPVAQPRKRAIDWSTLRWAPQLPFWSFYAPYLAGAVAGGFIVLVSSASATAAAVSKNQ